METTTEKYFLSHLTSTIKQLANINKILAEQVRTLTATNSRLTMYGGQQQQLNGQETISNDYKSKLDPTGYCWTNCFKFMRVHNR